MNLIDIGKLNKRISSLTPVERKDENGVITQVLEIKKTVWSTFYPIRGKEFYELAKIQSKTTHKCYVRYLDWVDSGNYIWYKKDIYYIDSVVDVEGKRKLLEINCYKRRGSEEMPCLI